MLPNSPYLTKMLLDGHVEELRRVAARSRWPRTAREDAPRPVGSHELPSTIPRWRRWAM
jgi:hypothetical protein